MDTRLLLMTGGDYPIPECQLTLHQPTVEEIAMVGEEDFFIGLQMLTLNKMMFDLDESVLSTTNNFQIFMTIISQKENISKKNAVIQVLTLLLPNKKISFTPNSIIITEEKKDMIIIDSNNFNFLQATINTIFCIGGKSNEDYNPADAEAKRIAEKIMKGRQKVAAEKGDNKGSIFTTYISVLSTGLHIPVTELIKYTVFMVYDQLQRLGLYIEYDIDICARLAGAQMNSQPENWMKNMY